MAYCPACGSPVTSSARFCASCGHALGTTAPAVSRNVTPTEERRLVTALFCDLVGFTAMSEAADPEDVSHVLDAYFAASRTAIERHGGVVEKFIGDAVVGVFGVPAAHEDDPLRAVRAGLDICAAAAALTSLIGQPLRLRVGVNTGEALVRLGVDSTSGEGFMVGDAINTASRIQSAAPELGVGVGRSTWQATRLAVDYEELPPATLKGKAEPVRIFAARALRTTPGIDSSRTHMGPYVGRSVELARLVELVAQARAGSAASPVAIVTGEPGIGKSRLLLELERGGGSDSSVTWRRGHCLPYGDGVTFWALGEIVKQHAGILEGDDADTATAKLQATLSRSDDDGWLLAQLLPLLGLAGDTSASREEAFLAWRNFLRRMAGNGTAVIVIEDLHWADEALVDFVVGLAREPLDRVVVVATARPELFSTHADLATTPGLARIDVRPLTDGDTEALIAGLLDAVVPHELHGPLLERAQGNPLFAEEYVRLLGDLDLLETRDGGVVLREGAAMPLPESITALIAARLDALPPGVKPVLADASVLGTTFWSGGVATIAGRDRDAVDALLAEAARLELVRPSPSSSMAGETEYAFWHVLARDVAYAQLPRPARALRHLAAADWLAARAGDRVEDIAHLLAYHTATALELSRATGDAATAQRVLPDAIHYHRLAGDRAMALDPAAAEAFYRAALRLAGGEAPERRSLLRAAGVAAARAGRYDAAVEALREVLAAAEAAGDPREIASALLDLYNPTRYSGTFDRSMTQRALAILETLPPSDELLNALLQTASTDLLLGDLPEAMGAADRAVAVAAELGREPPAMALVWRGSIRSCMGDPGWREDGLRGLALARVETDSRATAIAYNEVNTNIYSWDGPMAAAALAAEGLAFARQRGLGVARVLSANLAGALADVGRFAETLAQATELFDEVALAERTLAPGIAALMAQVHLATGHLDEAVQTADLVESLLTNDSDPWDVDTLITASRVRLASGDLAQARLLLRRAVDRSGAMGWYLRDGFSIAVATGELDLARTMLDGPRFHDPVSEVSWLAGRAHVAEAEGRLDDAARDFREVADRRRAGGWRVDEGQALIGLARCLAGLGRIDEAREPLAAAVAMFTEMGAAGFLAEMAPVRAQVDAAGT